MKNTNFFKQITILLFILVLASCDKDYNTIGGDVIGGANFNFQKENFSIKAYNQKINAVETNNLPVNQLGIMNNAIFGKTKANFVTQLSLASSSVGRVFDPLDERNIEIDSVVLSIPYFFTRTGATTPGGAKGTYSLNSVYSDNANPNIYTPINLKVYENGYYLRDFDPNGGLETTQKYYSDEDALFDGAKGTLLNDDLNVLENTSFTPDLKEYEQTKVVVTKTYPVSSDVYLNSYTRDPLTVEVRKTPQIRLQLNKSFFETKIIQTAASNLSSDNAFRNHFKGLYFQVADAPAGTLYNLDFRKGDITIYYKEDLIVKNAAGVVIGNDRPRKIFSMTLTGNSVSLLNNTDEATNYIPQATAPVTSAGHKKLFVKGGQGCQTLIELFSAQELADLRFNKDKQIINQANLIFTIDQTAITNARREEPLRLYLYNANTGAPIDDYNFDSTTDTDTKYNKGIYSGIIQRVGGLRTGKGIRYVVNITEHINRIVNGNGENVRLGLVVTDEIGYIANGLLRAPITSPRLFDRTPKASIMSSLGTLGYGSDYIEGDADYDKRIKFEVYYTKPN